MAAAASSAAAATTDTPSPGYQYGNCHCGNIRFGVKLTGDLYDQELTECNCSICSRNGYLFIFTHESTIEWQQPREESMKSYTFANATLAHHFCPICGTSVAAQALGSDSPWAGYWGVNARVLKGFEEKKFEKKKFMDGWALEPQYKLATE